jgi:hypothetical protein
VWEKERERYSTDVQTASHEKGGHDAGFLRTSFVTMYENSVRGHALRTIMRTLTIMRKSPNLLRSYDQYVPAELDTSPASSELECIPADLFSMPKEGYRQHPGEEAGVEDHERERIQHAREGR